MYSAAALLAKHLLFLFLTLRHQRWLPHRVRGHIRGLATYTGVYRGLHPALPQVNLRQLLGLQELPVSGLKLSCSSQTGSQISRPSIPNASPRQSQTDVS
jgi:hypothetical protein